MDRAVGSQDELGGLEMRSRAPLHVQPQTFVDLIHVQAVKNGEVERLILLHGPGPLLVVRREGHHRDFHVPEAVQLGLQTGQLPVAVASPVSAIEGDERPRALDVFGEAHGLSIDAGRRQRWEPVSVLQSLHRPSNVRSGVRLRALGAGGTTGRGTRFQCNDGAGRNATVGTGHLAEKLRLLHVIVL